MNAVRSLMLLFAVLLVACDGYYHTYGDGALYDQGAGDLQVDITPDVLTPDTVMSPPVIDKVIDAGQDGTALVGENVDLSGSNFGTNCGVLLGTIKAEVVSSSQVDLRFQTPEGVPVGQNSGTLSCDNGSAAFQLTVGRHHLVTVPDKDRVVVLTETSPGKIVDSTKRVTFTSPDRVVLSDDSAVAYVATERNLIKAPKIGMIDVVAAGGPKLLSTSVPYSELVKMPIYGMAVAADAPVLAVAGGLYVLFYDISDPQKPVKKGKIQFVTLIPGKNLPQILAGFFIDVALSPDGKTAVLLDGAADQIHIYNISDMAKPLAVQTKISISAGTSSKPIVSIPGISGLLGLLKVRGGSAQDVEISPDGNRIIVLAGGGIGALLPETFTLDLKNTTISVWDRIANAYLTKLEYLKDAHFPNNVVFAPSGDAFVSSVSSSTALLTKVLFQIAVMALVGGGSLDLKDLATLLFTNFTDLIDIIKAAWQGKLFDLGGLHKVVNNKASQGSFSHIPYIQGGMCATYDGSVLLSAGQGWYVDIKLGFPKIVERFTLQYNLGVTVHDLKAKKYSFLNFYTWKIPMLLPPWFFGQAACQR